MKITAWRITKKKYATEAFTGEGAKLFGGRWNPAGYAVVYLAQNLSLAILELIVHLEEDADIGAYRAIPVRFDSILVHVLEQDKLPKNWSSLPVSGQSQMVGKQWLEKKQSLLLQVPSSVVPSESNFLVNPRRPDVSKLEIGSSRPLHIDHRISKILH